MNDYEVEVVFHVSADTADEAIAQLRAVLDRVEVKYGDGVNGYEILDGAAAEV